MKAVVLYESLTGNTRRAAELIGGELARAGVTVAVHPITDPDLHELSQADVVFVGTWVDGFVFAGQRPGRAGRLWKLPVLDRKRVAVFCTYAINAGKALDKTGRILRAKGADVFAGGLLKRDRLENDCAVFVDRVLELAGAPTPSADSPA